LSAGCPGRCIAALGGLAIVLFANVGATSPEQERLEVLRSRLERLRADIAETEENRAEARGQLRDSERAISGANRRLHELAAKRDSARARLRALSAQDRATSQELRARRGTLSQLLVQRYLYGDPSYTRLILSGRDPSQTARDLHYYSYVTSAEARLIGTLRETLMRLTGLERAMREESAALADIASEQRARKTELLKQQAERRRILARTSGHLRDQRREARTLERDQVRLSRLVEAIGKALTGPFEAMRNDKLPETDGPERRFPALKGSLRLPARGQITSRFGSPRPGGGPIWKGLFIRSPAGEPVHAVASGLVVFADWLRGFGNLLIIDHGDAYLTIYGNNESLLKQVGDVVRTGELIATTGNSGGSPNSGIYFEARHEGKPFDPLRWVSLR